MCSPFSQDTYRRSAICPKVFLSCFILTSFFLLASAAQGQEDKSPRPLGMGKAIQRELARGQSHDYTIVLASGEYLHVVVNQHGVDLIVELFSPDAKPLVELERPLSTEGTKAVLAIAESSGSYRLQIRSRAKNETPGHYVINIEELRAADQAVWIVFLSVPN